MNALSIKKKQLFISHQLPQYL